MTEKESSTSPNVVTIKKYANRRLYNTATSNYVTLDHLCQMVKEGTEFVVYDAKTGEDITRSVLTQIIVEEENKGGQTMLPVSFLRQLIAMYGNSMQALMPHYLEASMENFQANQRKLQEMFKQSMGGEAFAKMAETNMAMFKAAANAFMPKPGESGEVSRSTTKGDDELSALRTQMAEMQKKLDSLGK